MHELRQHERLQLILRCLAEDRGRPGSSAKVPSGVGLVVRDAFMRFAFRFFITEKAMAWQFDHRVDWDRRLAPA